MPSVHGPIRSHPLTRTFCFWCGKDRHIIWLEPEGLTSDLVYPNGLSGPYPVDVQLQLVRKHASFPPYVTI